MPVPRVDMLKEVLHVLDPPGALAAESAAALSLPTDAHLFQTTHRGQCLLCASAASVFFRGTLCVVHSPMHDPKADTAQASLSCAVAQYISRPRLCSTIRVQIQSPSAPHMYLLTLRMHAARAAGSEIYNSL